MTRTRISFLGFGKQARRDAARQAVPPRVVKSLLGVLQYMEHAEEEHYHATPIGERRGHIYRDLRRIKAWLTDWTNNDWDYPAMLPALGDVVLALDDSKLPAPEEVQQVLAAEMLPLLLDTHAMHRWGEGPDVAASEGNSSEYAAAHAHQGHFETDHYVRIGEATVKLTLRTLLSATTEVRAAKSEWPDAADGGKYSYLYDGLHSHPQNWPWVPRDPQAAGNVADVNTPIGSLSSITLPITYHQNLDEEFVEWARGYGCYDKMLRLAGEAAIRARHGEARIEAGDAAHGCQPDVFTLTLGWPRELRVHYTIEDRQVVIRGYSWEVSDPQAENVFRCGFYADTKWHPLAADLPADILRQTER